MSGHHHGRGSGPAHGTTGVPAGGRGPDRHHHAHDHADQHGPADVSRAFVVGIALNAGFVVAEVVFGLRGHSLSLLADAGHNLSDVLALAVAAGAAALARRGPTTRFTYGLGSTSILAALFNAVVLLLVVGGLSWEAIGRLLHPEPVAGGLVMAVAAAGIAVNGLCAWLFAAGRAGDLNLRGAFAHMAADAVLSAGVVLAGLLILLTGWRALDPLVGLVVNAAIVAGTWGLLRDSMGMALAAVPQGVDPAGVRAFLCERAGVVSVHDLHIWPLSTTQTAMTAHLVMPGGHPGDLFLAAVCDGLDERYKIGHATLQIETDAAACALARHAA